MRIRLLSLLALAPGLQAQEPNPFVNKGPGEAPIAAAGAPFVNVIEHILVPADLVDPWIEEHPLNGDASALRAAAQQWIAEGKATLDQTAISTGTAGAAGKNDSRVEQFYATEFEPPNPGEWPFPTSFETRDIGYNNEFSAGMEGGAMSLLATVRFTRMVPFQEAWYPLAEQTREPDDIFIPRFEAVSLFRNPESVPGGEILSRPRLSPQLQLPRRMRILSAPADLPRLRRLFQASPAGSRLLPAGSSLPTARSKRSRRI
ncbi:hypothetical protein [Luteolibacter sp. Populi]|uniref:hypothetical protein n=1 Tax=Luteolibacter sp. Populi TaxID=3230487 RepID=UPI0034665A60